MLHFTTLYHKAALNLQDISSVIILFTPLALTLLIYFLYINIHIIHTYIHAYICVCALARASVYVLCIYYSQSFNIQSTQVPHNATWLSSHVDRRLFRSTAQLQRLELGTYRGPANLKNTRNNSRTPGIDRAHFYRSAILLNPAPFQFSLAMAVSSWCLIGQIMGQCKR